MGFGGGGGSDVQRVQQTTTTLPEYARPYYEDLLARTGYETSIPYEPYEGQRVAYFSPFEQEAMARYGELGMSGTPEELNEAGRVAAGIAGSPMDTGINRIRGSTYRASDPNVTFDPRSRQSQYTAGTRESEYQANQMGPGGIYEYGQREVGFVPGSLADREALQRYADPYYQDVVDVEKREAARQADIRNKNIGLTAAGIGSLGGYREGIERSENERNLRTQMGDIQTRGSQAAFESAKRSFEADRAAGAKLEEFEQSQFGMNEQMRQRAAELVQQGFSVNEAARQAQEEFASRQFGLNQQAMQEQERLTQSQFGMNEASRQFKAELEAEMYKASEEAKQRAAELGLKGEEIQQAGEIAAAEIKTRMEQNRLAGAGMLGDFADQRQRMELERLSLMEKAGLGERQMLQQGLDVGYGDWLRQQAYPKEQLAFYSQMLQGTPVQPGSTVSTYGDQPTTMQQLLGTGIAGAGLYNAYRGG